MMNLTEIEMKRLIHENSLLRKELERYHWKEVEVIQPPSGCSLLLYTNTGILIQGPGNVKSATHWMHKPPSPGKQLGELK